MYEKAMSQFVPGWGNRPFLHFDRGCPYPPTLKIVKVLVVAVTLGRGLTAVLHSERMAVRCYAPHVGPEGRTAFRSEGMAGKYPWGHCVCYETMHSLVKGSSRT